MFLLRRKKIAVFWDVISCSLVDTDWRSEEITAFIIRVTSDTQLCCRGYKLFRNAGHKQWHCSVQHSRRQPYSTSQYLTTYCITLHLCYCKHMHIFLRILSSFSYSGMCHPFKFIQISKDTEQTNKFLGMSDKYEQWQSIKRLKVFICTLKTCGI